MEEKGELTFADEYGIMNVIEVKQMKQKLTALLLAALLARLCHLVNKKITKISRKIAKKRIPIF